MKIKYRLGLDLGANSLGWCVYRLGADNDPIQIVRAGVRIFSDGRDPKSLASRAADRRLARQARRRRDRMLKRRARIMEGLIRFGLMPADVQTRKVMQVDDPFTLRAAGLDKPLTPHQLGRALFHLCRKRGFKSSRKDRGDEKETGKVKTAIAVLRARIATTNSRTVGEYLAKERAEGRPVRARRRPDGAYVLYLQRDMVAAEFDLLWETQRQFHPEVLTEEARSYLRDALLFQRKLVPVEPGRCLFELEEPRARLSSPYQQEFRILQELNNLRIVDGIEARGLTLEERDLLLGHLRTQIKATFPTLRGLIGVRRNSGVRFNLETENRKDLKGDLVGAQFSKPDCLGDAWWSLDRERQEKLSNLVATADSSDDLELTLSGPEWGFSKETAASLARCNLPDDFGSLSLKALKKIVPELRRDVVTYDVAVQRAGYQHHSQLHTGEFLKALPYYGEILVGYTSPAIKATDPNEKRFGKISNPTVHIGLNQLRLLVNALIKRYGNPTEVVVELAREFGLGADRRRDLLKSQSENQDRNRRADERLAELGVKPSRVNRQKLQLWDELGVMDRRCVYSGANLSMATLYSDEVEVDHVLPFSRSLHDGIGNKVLCTRQANRDKGNRTPFEAFGHSPGAYNWADILDRASSLPPSKSRHFAEDALIDFLDGKDFLDRHLTDTAYLSKVSRQYLSYVCHKDRVWVSTGKLTSMLRGKFALNELLSADRSKNRDDHRHHALDAAVIGLCSRRLIQGISTAAARAESHGTNRLLEHLDLPWPTYREELESTLDKIIVSYKPDHGKQTGLHNDTNYGFRGDADAKGATLVGHRVPLESIQPKDIDSISGEGLQVSLREALHGISSPKDVKSALVAFSERTGVRRVIKIERLSVIPINDRRTGVPYRYVKGDGNYCYEIYLVGPDKWAGEVINNFSANQRDWIESSTIASCGKPLVMRLRKDDILRIEEKGDSRIVRVAKFSDGKIALIDHHESNVDARTRDASSGLKYLFKSPSALRELKARIVGVDILGYVNDSGARV